MNIKVTNDGACACIEVTNPEGEVVSSVDVEAGNEVTLTTLPEGKIDISQVSPTEGDGAPVGQADVGGSGEAETSEPGETDAADAGSSGEGDEPPAAA